MDTVFNVIGWILAVGAALVILYIANDYLGKREHSDAPFTRGYSPTRPPASLVPPSAESSRTAVTPPPGRSDYLVTQILVADLVDLKGAKGLVLQPVGSHKTNPFTPTPQAKRDATRAPADEVARDPNPYRPFSGEEDIQAQIDMFIWEQNK